MDIDRMKFELWKVMAYWTILADLMIIGGIR